MKVSHDACTNNYTFLFCLEELYSEKTFGKPVGPGMAPASANNQGSLDESGQNGDRV